LEQISVIFLQISQEDYQLADELVYDYNFDNGRSSCSYLEFYLFIYGRIFESKRNSVWLPHGKIAPKIISGDSTFLIWKNIRYQ